MSGTILGWLLPANVKDKAVWFFNHPAYPKEVDFMTLPDIGIVAYLFIMGMMLRVSYHRRRQTTSHLLIIAAFLRRFLVLFLIGGLFYGLGPIVVSGDFYKVAGLVMFYWGPLHTIALAGVTSLLFITMRRSYLLIAFFSMITAYHLAFAYWPELPNYNSESKFGGPIAAIFGFAPVVVISFLFADWLILDGEFNFKKWSLESVAFKAGILFLGLFIAAVILNFYFAIPINMRQVSVPYLFISLGIVILGVCLFAFFGSKNDVSIPILSSLGKNCLVIFIALLCFSYFKSDFGEFRNKIALLLLFSLPFCAMYLDKRKYFL